jgi:hypothetical protein
MYAKQSHGWSHGAAVIRGKGRKEPLDRSVLDAEKKGPLRVFVFLEKGVADDRNWQLAPGNIGHRQ